MPQSAELEERIASALPGAQVSVEDLTGGGDHFRAEIVSDRFEGLSRIEQHKLVYDVFGDEIGGAHPRSVHQDLQPRKTRSHAMTNDEIRAFIENAIKENKVILFMKGIPNQPACGFSARTAGALNALGVQYAALDILPDPRIREELSGLSGWPTIPQLFVDGELVGGSDIVMEMFESGELAELLGAEPPDEPFEPEPQPEPVQRPMALENRLEQN